MAFFTLEILEEESFNFVIHSAHVGVAELNVLIRDKNETSLIC